jgi:opacity protein-like surface antigen
MKKIILIICLILSGVSISSAQQTTEDFSKNEIFTGYSYHNADADSPFVTANRTGQNGFNLAYTRNLNKNVGITGDISAHFSRKTETVAGGELKTKRDQYYLLGGVQFKAPNNSRVTPFAHALIGGSFFRGSISNLTPSGNFYIFNDAKSFATAVGGGLDLRVNKRVAVRLIQADYIPTFFNSRRQDNFRLSFGIIFK